MIGLFVCVVIARGVSIGAVIHENLDYSFGNLDGGCGCSPPIRSVPSVWFFLFDDKVLVL